MQGTTIGTYLSCKKITTEVYTMKCRVYIDELRGMNPSQKSVFTDRSGSTRIEVYRSSLFNLKIIEAHSSILKYIETWNTITHRVTPPSASVCPYVCSACVARTSEHLAAL